MMSLFHMVMAAFVVADLSVRMCGVLMSRMIMSQSACCQSTDEYSQPHEHYDSSPSHMAFLHLIHFLSSHIMVMLFIMEFISLTISMFSAFIMVMFMAMQIMSVIPDLISKVSDNHSDHEQHCEQNHGLFWNHCQHDKGLIAR